MGEFDVQIGTGPHAENPTWPAKLLKRKKLKKIFDLNIRSGIGTSRAVTFDGVLDKVAKRQPQRILVTAQPAWNVRARSIDRGTGLTRLWFELCDNRLDERARVAGLSTPTLSPYIEECAGPRCSIMGGCPSCPTR